MPQARAAREKERSRHIILGAAISKLKDQVAYSGTTSRALQSIREYLLDAAASSVSEALNLKKETIASLLDFSTGDTARMRVVARSTKERKLGEVYEVGKLVSWTAISNGKIAIVDDINNDSRFEKFGDRPYRAIAALPVTHNNRAYGALSFTSEVPYAFFGRSDEITIKAHPYLALLALTYDKKDLSCLCNYDATNI